VESGSREEKTRQNKKNLEFGSDLIRKKNSSQPAREKPPRVFAYIVRRLALMLVTLVGISIIIFVAAARRSRQHRRHPVRRKPARRSPPTRPISKRSLASILPIYQQYLNWIGGLLHGDLGYSYVLGKSRRCRRSCHATRGCDVIKPFLVKLGADPGASDRGAVDAASQLPPGKQEAASAPPLSKR